MMFPKPQQRKKRKKHKASILHCKDGTCYLCMILEGVYCKYSNLHEHHIFGGPNRAASEAEGLKVYLCPAHHIDGPEAVHNNHANMRFLQQEGQKAYEYTHTREEFMKLIGKNYLDEVAEEYREVQADLEKNDIGKVVYGVFRNHDETIVIRKGTLTNVTDHTVTVSYGGYYQSYAESDIGKIIFYDENEAENRVEELTRYNRWS